MVPSNNSENGVVLSIVKKNLERLTPATQKVALYIISSPGKVLDQTAVQVAEASNTSEASVIRLCKELGFSGFHNFQIKLAQDLGADNNRPVPQNINQDDSSWKILNKIISAEQENLETTLNVINKETFSKTVEILAQTDRIGFFAVGSSFPVIYDAYWRFSKIGILCQIQQDHGGQLMIAESLDNNSVGFAVSRSGQSRIPIRALQTAQKNGIKTVCLTQNPKSEITKYSDYSLVTSERSNRIHDAATSSRIAHLGVLDALYSAVTVKKWGEATKNMKKYSNLIRAEQF